MRAIVRATRAAARHSRRRARRMCVFCGVAIGAEVQLCWRCRDTYAPSAIDNLISLTGITVDEIVQRSGVSRRTVIRARQKLHISKRSAKALAAATGLALSRFVVDDDEDVEEWAA